MTILTPFINSICTILADNEEGYALRLRLIDLMLAMSKAEGAPVAVATVTQHPTEGLPVSRFRVVDPGSASYGRKPHESFFIDGTLFASKIYAIKYLRSKTYMGLKEAKDYIETLPPVFVSYGESVPYTVHEEV